jgi:hypothetical protein
LLRISVRVSSTLVAIWLLITVAVACGGSAAPVATPKPAPTEVVTKFFTALKASDCQTAFSLLVDPIRSRIKSADRVCIAYSGQNQLVDFKVGAATSTGPTTATVPVTQTTGKGTSNVVVTVTLVNGVWSISDLASA